MLFGELVEVLEQDAHWYKIRGARDRYQGYIEADSCDLTNTSTSHWVVTRATLVFENPDIKSTVVQRLLFGSELSLSDTSIGESFQKVCGGGFVWAAHCRPINTALKSSMIEIALSNYLHAPYLWGGRSTDGCDCSGLVQMLAMAVGFGLPRDSADQEASLKSDVKYEDRAAEDLVYWPGHVGILQSQDQLLHATAHSLSCCIEPLADVVERAGQASSIKRLL